MTSASGISFPVGGDGQRRSTGTGRAIIADAVRSVDPDLAGRIEATSDWRRGYLGPMRTMVLDAAMDPARAHAIAAAGLASTYQRFRFVRDSGEQSITAAMDEPRDGHLGTITIHGSAPREPELTLLHQGRRLFDSDLRRQLARWVSVGITEPGVAEAINLVLDNPDWLDLRDLHVAVLGAGAELAPTRSLLRWGAHVHAVDLPSPAVWTRLISSARDSAGTLHIPITHDRDGRPPFMLGANAHPDEDDIVAGGAGVNLLEDTPEIAAWLQSAPGPLTIGCYAYADGGTHTLLSVASDAVADQLLQRRADVTFAALATPTDAFMVPVAAVQHSRRRWDARGLSQLLQTPLRIAGQFEPNYPETYTDVHGREFGINDSLVLQQGPNYALAKRLQQWRAFDCLRTGRPTSLNIAPATRTQSVVRNRLLAAAYSGAGRFGIEVFEPATSTTLMAALLVHDLRNPRALGQPGVAPVQPLDLLTHKAVHGGLWRAAYSPRSVLSIAALLGALDPRS
jgi:hypothetical protein